MSKLRIRTSDTAPNLMKKLVRLKAWDLEIERRRKIWGWMWGLSIVFTILTLILAANMQKNGADDAIFIFPALFIISFIVSLIIYIIQVKKDLDNRKLDIAMKLVERIGEDISPENPAEIAVDFMEYRKGGKQVSKTGGFLSGIKEFQYVHPWFTFSGKLFDGNKFDVAIEMEVKRKEKRKRKYTKVKEAFSEKATLSVRLNPKIYPNPAQVAEFIPTGLTPYGFEIKRALGTDKALKVTLETGTSVIMQGRGGKSGTLDNLINGDRLLGLFVQAYSGIAKARPVGAVPTQPSANP